MIPQKYKAQKYKNIYYINIYNITFDKNQTAHFMDTLQPELLFPRMQITQTLLNIKIFIIHKYFHTFIYCSKLRNIVGKQIWQI